MDGDTLDIVRLPAGEHCSIRTLGGSYELDGRYGNARTRSERSLRAGETETLATLIWTYSTGDDPDYRVSAAEGDATYRVTSSVTRDEYCLGRAETPVPADCGGFDVQAKLFWIEPVEGGAPRYFALVDGSLLRQQEPSHDLFASSQPASIECTLAGDAPRGGTIVAGPGVTTVSRFYVPSGRQLMVDGQPVSVPFTVEEGVHDLSFPCADVAEAR
jgi:hypothetical protein